jgi:hypothetical protein
MRKNIRYVHSAIEDSIPTKPSLHGEGMALNILTRAEEMVGDKDNLESHSHTKWKRAK